MRLTRLARISPSWHPLIAAAALLWAAPAALAQTERPAWEIAAGGTLGFPSVPEIGPDCDLDGAMLTNCSLRSREWWISPAWHVTDRVALVGEVSGRFVDLETAVTIPDLSPGFFPDLPPIAADISTSTYAFSGGVRVSGPRGRRVTPFVQALAGFGRRTGTFEVLFVRDSVTSSGFLIEPSAGVDIHVARRIAVRVLAGYGAAFAEGTTEHAVRVGAGVVFGLGSR